MVRFSIGYVDKKQGYNNDIYIPLWLDFQYSRKADGNKVELNLHSTMVRFSIIIF